MIVNVGCNFLLDPEAMDTLGSYATEDKSIKVQNGMFDKLYLENGTDKPYDPDYSTEWDLLTIMSAGFNNNLNAGNLEYLLGVIKGVRIKRREVGTKDWALLAEYALSPNSTLKFNLVDNTAKSNTEYEYALVPILDIDGGSEAQYMINTIMTSFDGVYICDKDTIYKFYSGVSFGTGEQRNVTGIYEPMGRKYPIIVSNGVTSYYKSSLKSTIITDDDLKNHTINRKEEVVYRKNILDFLTNHKPKIIKDWNGNAWLVMVLDNPRIEPNNYLGFGISDIEFNYAEVGDANSTEDLILSGLSDE